MLRSTLRLFVFLALLAAPATAHAVLVNFSISGTVTSVDANNAFGLAANDTVTATAMFDDDLLSPSLPSFIEFGVGGNSFGGMLTFNIGSVVLVETMDVTFDFLFPSLQFSGTTFTDFSAQFLAGFNGAPVDFGAGTDFTGQDGLVGVWDFNSVSITPKLSLPATLPLLALGLGAIGLAVRRRVTSRPGAQT